MSLSKLEIHLIVELKHRICIVQQQNVGLGLTCFMLNLCQMFPVTSAQLETLLLLRSDSLFSRGVRYSSMGKLASENDQKVLRYLSQGVSMLYWGSRLVTPCLGLQLGWMVLPPSLPIH